jgi:hypothetical protein
LHQIQKLNAQEIQEATPLVLLKIARTVNNVFNVWMR